MRRPESSAGGYSLVESIIVMAIIATLSTIGFVRYRRVVDRAEEVVSIAELRDILEALFLYEETHRCFPATLDDLGLGVLLDPWGNPYQYLNFASLPASGAGSSAPASPPDPGGSVAPGGQGGGKSGGAGGNGGADPGSAGGAHAADETGQPATDVPSGGAMRKDRFLVPINTYFDLYSMGPDGMSAAPLTAAASRDDLIVANDGDYIGLASLY